MSPTEKGEGGGGAGRSFFGSGFLGSGLAAAFFGSALAAAFLGSGFAAGFLGSGFFGSGLAAALFTGLVGSTPGAFFPVREIGRMTLLAAAAAVPAAVLWRALPAMHVALQALAVVGLYGAVYLLLARITGAEELGFWLGRFARRRR